MANTARISPESDAIIEELAHKTGKSKIVIIEEALESYRFHERMRMFNESYAKLKNDDDLWKSELQDRQELEGTIGDGLEDE